MTAPTAASRAAAARQRRRATPTRARAVPAAPKDPCPTCGVELGQPHGASRRLVVFTADRGQFRWQCPDCRAAWTEGASTQRPPTQRPSTQRPSTQLPASQNVTGRSA